jgi:hypothetical protein
MTTGGPWGRSFASVCIVAFLFSCSAVGDGLEKWRWRNPLPQGETLQNVCFAGDRFFAFGPRSALSSSNGTEWLPCDFPQDVQVHVLTSGNGILVAVGANGVVLTSSDGLSWTSQPSATTNALLSVAYGNGVFVAVGSGIGPPVVISSLDGSNWVDRTPLGITGGLQGVTYGNGLFVAQGSAFNVWVSSDGSSWNGIAAGSCFGGGITYGANRFVAVGQYFRQNGNESIYVGSALTSSDGQDWTRIDHGTGNLFEGIAFGNGRFVSITFGRDAFVSEDGLTWTNAMVDTTDSLYSVAFGNGTFVAVGLGGNILTSTNGLDWTSQRIGNSESLWDIAYGSGRYVAVGGVIQSSPDGRTWTAQPGRQAKAVAYGNARFVAVGGRNSLSSATGDEWVEGTNGTPYVFNDVAFGGGSFVGVGSGGLLARSTDGLNWASTGGGGGMLYSVVHGNGRFVAVGGELSLTELLSSTDGVNWTNSASSLTNRLSGNAYSVAHGNGRFVASGAYSPSEAVLFISVDGLRWSIFRRPGPPIYNLGYGHGVFLGIQNGRIVTSKLGQTWTARASTTPLQAFIPVEQTFIGVGAYGAICESDPVIGRFISGTVLSSGAFQATFEGLISESYRIQRSSNLVEWTLISVISPPTGTQTFIDPIAPGPRSFYRSVTP